MTFSVLSLHIVGNDAAGWWQITGKILILSAVLIAQLVKKCDITLNKEETLYNELFKTHVN